MLSSVLLLLMIVCVCFFLKYRQYRSRPYLLAFFLFLLQLFGIGGFLLLSLQEGQTSAPFDTILRPGTLITGFTTFVFLLAYIVEIKYPGKLSLKKTLIIISPFLISSAILILIKPSPLHSLEELFDGINRLDVILRLIIIFFFIAYPISAACQPYQGLQCLVSRKTVATLHILSCIISPIFITGMMCGFFPAIILNYISAIIADALIVYIEFKIRIPVTEPIPDYETNQEQEKTDTKQQGSESIFDKPEIWMNPDMTATELAKMIGTNNTYLSNKIKALGYSNYSDMINRKRVEYICKEIRNKTDLSITSLMYEAGFRSRSTANYEFKRIVGCTPSEYRDSIG